MTDPADRRRVLLAVDDEEDMRFLMQLCFAGTEYELRTAASGAEALEVLAEEDIDLVFLDLRMPVVDGWEVLRRLRESEELPRPPVVVVSAHASDQDADRVLDEGAANFLSKPYTRQQVLELAAEHAPLET